MGGFERTTVRIPSADGKNELDAWVYRPTGSEGPFPAVVMAHGFGLNKSMGLQSYAEPFAESGRLVVVFDYRYFGASDGQPREYLSVSQQLQDYKTVLDWTKTRDDVKKDEVVVWGTSFAGGHAFSIAATYPGLAGAIAQVPHMSGIHGIWATSKISNLRITLPLLYDGIARILTFLPPAYVPTVGDNGSYALLTTVDAVKGYETFEPFGATETEHNEKMKKLGSKHLRIRGSTPFEVLAYSPIKESGKIKIPLLTIVAEEDTMCSPSQGVLGAEKCGAEIVRTPGGHFGAYRGGPAYEQSLEAQLKFLNKVTGPSKAKL